MNNNISVNMIAYIFVVGIAAGFGVHAALHGDWLTLIAAIIVAASNGVRLLSEWLRIQGF